MFGKQPRDTHPATQSSSSWPRFGDHAPSDLERAIRGFLCARTVSDCQKPTEELLRVAGVNVGPLERKTGRSLWTWYAAWLDSSPPPTAATRVQFSVFVDEYHDTFAQQAHPLTVATLGRASDDLRIKLIADGLAACAQLDPASAAVPGLAPTVADMRRAWSSST